jgi:ABC-2 type transport system ATP-binding protein
MSDALATHGLGRRYGSKWALRDCTLAIPRGAVTALVGPNGAGKTTLLRLAVGLARSTTGSVEVLGIDPRGDADELLPRIGFVAHGRRRSSASRCSARCSRAAGSPCS